MEHPIYSLLEFDKVLGACATEASSELGRQRVLASRPLADIPSAEAELALVTEMADLLGITSIPIQGLSDIQAILRKVAPAGATLDRDEYVPLHDVIGAAHRIRGFLLEREEPLAGLKEMAVRLGDFDDLRELYNRIFDAHGDIRDDASAELKRIRRQRAAEEKKLHTATERVIRRWKADNYTQEDTPAFREGKLLIPVKAEHRGRVEGIVVDESTSGATVFVEPLEVIAIGNTLRKLESEERREIIRILLELCDSIRSDLPEITVSLEILSRLDHIYARARFSRRLNGVQPLISRAAVIKLKEARHPLLAIKANTEVVSLSVVLGEKDGNILVITGPNAGGKTVALKTIGLLVLMASCGMHVPALEGSEIPLIHALHCDIGDPQSLEQDLSTYTSHLLRLKLALEDEREPKLILLDEFGSGTDPAEGSAIAKAALLEFRRQGSLVVTTTHHGTLKVFAQETGGIFNGSMEFDSETLQPTFRFRTGVPGSSYALEISSRVGIEQKIVDQARQFLGEDTTRLEQMIDRLNQSLRKSEERRQEAELKATELTALKKLYADRLEEVQSGEKERLRQAAREAKEILKDANKQIEAVVKEIREKEASRDAIKQAHTKIAQEKKKIEGVLAKGKKPEPVRDRWTGEAGGWVTIDSLKDPVQVLALRKDGAEAKLEVGGIHIWMDTKKLKAAAAPKGLNDAGKVKVSVSQPGDATHSYEIDLRGMLADEAEFALEKYLSDCILSGWRSVRIIHGKGTGAVRTRVQEVLKRSPDVKSYRYGRPEEGEFGVTVAELED